MVVGSRLSHRSLVAVNEWQRQERTASFVPPFRDWILVSDGRTIPPRREKPRSRLAQLSCRRSSYRRALLRGRMCRTKCAFVAMSRALGIPARSVTGFPTWAPWLKREDLVPDDIYSKITPDGLAAAKLYGPTGHVWAEIYLPNYGWVPADPTNGTFGELHNQVVTMSKGREVMIGPNAPPGDGHGYGDRWMPLRDGRANVIGWGVWNLASVRNAKVTVLQESDPFPADALAEYLTNLYPTQDSAKRLKEWRERMLRRFNDAARNAASTGGALTTLFDGRDQYYRQAFNCHLLRRTLGDEEFFEVVRTYENLRIASGEPVPTSRFKEIAERIHGSNLDWFFFALAHKHRLAEAAANLRKSSAIWHRLGHSRTNRAEERDPLPGSS